MIYFKKSDPLKSEKLASTLDTACKKGPVILFGDSGLARSILPKQDEPSHEVKPVASMEKSGYLHFTPVTGCKVIDENTIELDIINYGHTCTIRTSKKEVAELTEAIISTTVPEKK